ncbi:MAG: hypothetical protein ACK5ME_09645 [Parahaliea sp.]
MEAYIKGKFFIKTGVFVVFLFVSMLTNAANVLVATTQETRGDGIGIINNVYDLFVAVPGNVVTDGRGILGQASLVTTTPDFSGYDVVVVVAVHYGLEADEEAALISAINNRSSGVFALTLDGCCGDGGGGGPTGTYNGDTTVRILNAVMSPSPSSAVALGNHGFYPMTFSLSADSPYAYSFSGLPSLEGGAYKTVENLPQENILYYDSLNQASGVFLPETDTRGACVFSLLDASLFSNDFLAANAEFAQVVGDATLDPEGSCYRDKSGLIPSVTPQTVPVMPWYTAVLMLVLIPGLVSIYRRF